MADFRDFLHALREQEKDLLAQLEVVRGHISAAEEWAAKGGTSPHTEPPKNRHRMYRDMTLVEASRACLNATGRGMTAPELASALRAGGYESKAKKFTRMLYNVLYRTSGFKTVDGKWHIDDAAQEGHLAH